MVRPLSHPALEDITVEGILHALSDPVRAAIFGEIAASSGPQTYSAFLTVKERNIPKSTLSQHFKALREAGLIRSERLGVEMPNTSRCKESTRGSPDSSGRLWVRTCDRVRVGTRTALTRDCAEARSSQRLPLPSPRL